MPRITAKVLGIDVAQAAFKSLPDDVRNRLYDDALEPTARIILADEKSRLRPGHGYRTGTLQSALTLKGSRANGVVRVGISPGGYGAALPGGRVVSERPTAIGHLVEFGHGGPHPAPAYPFAVPAAAAQQQALAQRARIAVKNTAADKSGGTGTL